MKPQIDHRHFLPAAARFAAVCALASLAPVAQAQALKSGEQVYRETCQACHGAGVAGAPAFGDKGKWAPLIKEGQAVLSAHGWVGVRAMPPKGGKPDLALEEFARAVAHMARAAGGTWKDPDAKLMAAIRKEEKKRIEELAKKKS